MLFSIEIERKANGTGEKVGSLKDINEKMPWADKPKRQAAECLPKAKYCVSFYKCK